jgi:cytochrome c oxidase cbb3-type subunit 4
MSYEAVAMAAQQGGAIYFVVLFLGGLAYAVWPKNRDEFHRAAQSPFEEEE